jgi:hypothetical protein
LGVLQVTEYCANHFIDRGRLILPSDLWRHQRPDAALGDEGHSALTPKVAQQQSNISGKFFGIGAHR